MIKEVISNKNPQQALGAIMLLRGWGFLYWWERSSWAIQRLGARSAFQCERGRSGKLWLQTCPSGNASGKGWWVLAS